MNLTITKERKKKLDFTVPHSQTRQVLVQRKPEGWEKMSESQIEKALIRNQLELGNRKVYVQQNSSYYMRMLNLEEEIGDTIDIIDVPERCIPVTINISIPFSFEIFNINYFRNNIIWTSFNLV